MKAVLCAVVLLVAGTTIGLAQEGTTAQPKPKTPVVTQRQANQRARIRQGVKSGELTAGEAAKLRSEQRDIRAEKQAAKADGSVTPAERRDIRRDQNKASRDIYRSKHNARTRK